MSNNQGPWNPGGNPPQPQGPQGYGPQGQFPGGNPGQAPAWGGPQAPQGGMPGHGGGFPPAGGGMPPQGGAPQFGGPTPPKKGANKGLIGAIVGAVALLLVAGLWLGGRGESGGGDPTVATPTSSSAEATTGESSADPTDTASSDDETASSDPTETASSDDETTSSEPTETASPTPTANPSDEAKKRTMAVGNCITLTKVGASKFDEKKVDCNDSSVFSFKIVKSGAITKADCPKNYSTYTITYGKLSFYYCLMDNMHVNKCYAKATGNATGEMVVPCTDSRARFKVGKIHEGVADTKKCGTTRTIAATYELDPKRTYCLVPPK